MMRGLPVDFREDEKVLDITDQFMFGHSLMACPVTKPNAASRTVYLPKGASWIDFWTGAKYAGGRTIECDAREKLPVLVKAGSILPYGPSVQNAQQSQDPTELRVYPGANGAFTIYDDAGDGYGYEKGAYATIDLRWDDRTHTLTIGKRKGSYPGMPVSRTFRIVLVQPGVGVGIPSTAQVRRTAKYIGDRMVVRL